MVEGLDRFGEHFAAYTDQYVLIGGAACTLAMDEAGQPFRATKDLDIVLCLESLDARQNQELSNLAVDPDYAELLKKRREKAEVDIRKKDGKLVDYLQEPNVGG